MNDNELLSLAFKQAQRGREEGGIPIGAVLYANGRVLGTGYNRRVQLGSPILHAEIDCLRNAGRLPARVYKDATMVTTLSPCTMCTGAILLYKISRVVIGENRNFYGGEDTLRDCGVEVTVMHDQRCVDIMAEFAEAQPELWNEDIGEDV